MNQQAKALLSSGLASLNINLSSEQLALLEAYVELLKQWNKAINLSAIDSDEKIITHHILDCLAVLPFIDGASLADIGSGAGLPGIVLAIVKPELAVTLVEASQKRISFLRMLSYELNLNNITVIHEKVEAYAPEVKFDMVICRAFAAWPDYWSKVKHLVTPEGKIMAMKAKLDPAEYHQSAELINFKFQKIAVPHLTAQRHLVVASIGEGT